MYLNAFEVHPWWNTRNKIWRTMKITTIFLFVACLQVVAKTSPAQKITLKEKNAPLEKIFKQIRLQTGYEFIYNTQMLRTAKKIDIDVKDISVNDALDICFKDQPIIYEISNKTIIVSAKPSSHPSKDTEQEPKDTIKPTALKHITGKVTDMNGVPLSGATVMLYTPSVAKVQNVSNTIKTAEVKSDAIGNNPNASEAKPITPRNKSNPLDPSLSGIGWL